MTPLIYVACREGEHMRGIPQHLWWWEQEIVLDKVCPHSGALNDDIDSLVDFDSWDSETGG